MHLMRGNLKRSTIDNKKNELIILIRKKDIEKSTKMDTITLVSMAISRKPPKIREQDSQSWLYRY